MNTHDRVDAVILSSSILYGTKLQEVSGFVAVVEGRIAAIGPSWDAPDWIARAVRVIDVGDATITPGLTDAHIHPVLGASVARGLDLNGITEIEAVRTALADYAAATPHVTGADWLFA